MATQPHDTEAQLQPLPHEAGTIEFRTDGSVTVAGHRIRLKAIADAIGGADQAASLDDLAEIFPTIERQQLAKVRDYVSRNFAAVEQHVKQTEDNASQEMSTAKRQSVDELRRIARGT